MKYLIPIFAIGATSILFSCGNGESASQSESVSQSTQSQVATATQNATDSITQTESPSEVGAENEALASQEEGMSPGEIKQILSNYDPENEKFRLAELERRRNLALKADPSLQIPEPKQVVAQERAKYLKALEAQKKAKANPVKTVAVESEGKEDEYSDLKFEKIVQASTQEKTGVKEVKEKSPTPREESQPVAAKPESKTPKPTKANPVTTQPVKTEPIQTEAEKSVVSKPVLAKPSPTPPKTETKTQPIEKPVASKAGVAKINFDQMTFAFDTIVEGDVIDYQFKFVNTGTRTIEILNAKATCGCTRPSFPFLPIEPGQEGFIGVKYDSRTKSGNQTPEIDVITNFQDEPIKLYLKGFVKEKESEK